MLLGFKNIFNVLEILKECQDRSNILSYAGMLMTNADKICEEKSVKEV